jgi:hypothetical protein
MYHKNEFLQSKSLPVIVTHVLALQVYIGMQHCANVIGCWLAGKNNQPKVNMKALIFSSVQHAV